VHQENFPPWPVVVLSSSSEAADVQRAMSLGAEGYFVKPLLLSDLLELAKSLGTARSTSKEVP